MNNKNIEEQIRKVLKEAVNKITIGKQDFECINVNKAVKELTNLLQAEKEQYLDEFVKYLILQEYAWAKADIDCHFSFETTEDIEREVEQFKKESV